MYETMMPVLEGFFFPFLREVKKQAKLNVN